MLDTTVLVYAVGDAHEFRDPCRSLLSAIGAGTLIATTTPDVVQEFTHVRARRRGRGDAVELAEAFSDLLSPLLVIDEPALKAGLRIFGERDRPGALDAVLAAGAMASGAGTLASADRAFATVTGLRRVVPDAAGVAGLLDGTDQA